MVFWKKNNIVIDMVEEYLQKAEECVGLLKIGFTHYLKKGLGTEFDAFIEKTHKAESSCDDIKIKIESAMYEKSLIPESRGDILSLIESIDQIPNNAEHILYSIETQFLETPTEIKDKLEQLLNININAFYELTRAARALFKDTSKIQTISNNIDKEESASDYLERTIIRYIFSSENIAPDQRILFKELVGKLGSISDNCEKTADTIAIIAVKRIV